MNVPFIRTKIGGGKLLLCILLVLSFVFITGELYLRMHYGLCDAPLYSSDPDFEYMLIANQDGTRLGKHYHTNSYRQRSDEPDSTKKKVLGLGDSVMFGGTQSGNDEIASYFYDQLTGNQMLNISAGSWGPDNCSAYLKRYGTFDAKAMWLIVSSHDAHNNITHEEVVGRLPYYPEKQYFCAWFELIDRYVMPVVKSKLNVKKLQELDPDQKVLAGINKRYEKNAKPFNTGFVDLKRIADENNIPLYICLHAEKGEVEAGFYNGQGQEIIQWCQENNVPLYMDIEEGITLDMFRDDIHLNTEGNKFHAQLMVKYCKF